MNLKLIISSVIAGLLLSSHAFAVPKNPANYNEVLYAIEEGKEVSALINVSKCKYMEKMSDDNSIETRYMGILIGRSFDIIKRDRFDGKRLDALVSDQQNWDGTRDTYVLERKLIRIWEDNMVDVINDSIDPNTHKRLGTDRLICKATADGSGGVIFVTN